MTFLQTALLLFTGFVSWSRSAPVTEFVDSSGCPGYTASNVKRTDSSLTADLTLAGDACNIHGSDFKELKFLAEYQTESRVHVIIYDHDEQIYQVPDFVVPRPEGTHKAGESLLDVSIEEKPFSFTVTRKSNKEVLFTTKGSPIVFETQYLRLRTALPDDPNIYGIGEHTDHLRLPTSHFTRTLWARDAGAVPSGTNLYGSHPVYYEQRAESNHAHGVLFLNSNGMDVKIGKENGQYLEYNVLGGVLDFYFMAGPTPFDVAREYSDISQKAQMMPYWGFGFHQCRFGYKSIEEVGDVVKNYSAANIPLETMWTDIDYMDHYKVFTLGQGFNLDKVRNFVDKLHRDDQHYIVMVDPAVAYQNYSSFNRGADVDAFLKLSNGTIYKGRVWPGVTAYPDWFHPNTQGYWDKEFELFFDPLNGVDIDALWIDMNEPSNFCDWPCTNPWALSATEAALGLQQRSLPAPPSAYRPKRAPHPGPHGLRDADADIADTPRVVARAGKAGPKTGIQGRNLTVPSYAIKNHAGPLSQKTIDTDLVHHGGYAEYDTHNLYGTMMSKASRHSMLKRRPEKRPMVITRSTFLGAGSYVGHWLGDNVSAWDQYIASIRHLLQFVSFFQVPMVGADVCGFIGDATENLCARWTTLGAFYPFYRNHNMDGSKPQEAYRWESVASAARKAIDIRYRLLDYIYTAMHKQTVDGTPMLAPMWMHDSSDPKTYGIETQFFYGPSLLISPVTETDSTTVNFYLPPAYWYDLFTLKHIDATESGLEITYANVPFTDVPVHIRGGSIVPARVNSAKTTTALRKENFELLIATDENGEASGSLYIDDGDSLVQAATSEIEFSFADNKIKAEGSFNYKTSLSILSVTVLTPEKATKYTLNEGLDGSWEHDLSSKEGVAV